MSNQDVTQESLDWLQAELDAIQPSQGACEPSKQLAQANATLADMAAREAGRQEHAKALAHERKMSREREKRCAQFGWSHAEFAENWKLRNVPAPDKGAVGFTLRKSMWDLLIDRERKRVKADGKPRKNTRVNAMKPEEAVTHRRKQVQEAVTRHRAKKTAEAAANAAATGERLLTDDELALIEAAETPQAPLPVEDDRLASLQAAEDAEAN